MNTKEPLKKLKRRPNHRWVGAINVLDDGAMILWADAKKNRILWNEFVPGRTDPEVVLESLHRALLEPGERQPVLPGTIDFAGPEITELLKERLTECKVKVRNVELPAVLRDHMEEATRALRMGCFSDDPGLETGRLFELCGRLWKAEPWQLARPEESLELELNEQDYHCTFGGGFDGLLPSMAILLSWEDLEAMYWGEEEVPSGFFLDFHDAEAIGPGMRTELDRCGLDATKMEAVPAMVVALSGEPERSPTGKELELFAQLLEASILFFEEPPDADDEVTRTVKLQDGTSVQATWPVVVDVDSTEVDDDDMQSREALSEVIQETLDRQLESGDPPEATQALERMLAQGISESEARQRLGVLVTEEIYNVLHSQQPSDPVRYARALNRLPELPPELEAEFINLQQAGNRPAI